MGEISVVEAAVVAAAVEEMVAQTDLSLLHSRVETLDFATISGTDFPG